MPPCWRLTLAKDTPLGRPHCDAAGKIFSVSLLTQTFEAKDGGTLLTLTEQGTYMGDENAVAGREEGFRELLGKLGEEIARG